MKNIILFLFIFIISFDLHSEEIWIYSDDGTWLEGILALEQFLDYNEIPHKRVMAEDLNGKEVYENVSAICFPGGYSYNYKIALTQKTINKIREYVANGGAYIGICAGAFFASSNVVWEGIEYPYSLSLFEGRAVGSIHKIAVWDNYAMTTVNINKENPIVQNQKDDLSVLYYGGPYFESELTKFGTVAAWNDFNQSPAIINFEYENGKVLLIGPHLEIEENAVRDSTNFAEELDDVESDWDMLGDLFNWALDSQVSVETKNQEHSNITIHPNPASDYIEINLVGINLGAINPRVNPWVDGGVYDEIKIYNIFGELVIAESIHPMTPSHRMNVEHLPAGLYFIQIGNYSEKFMVAP